MRKQTSCLVEYQHSFELFGSITDVCFNLNADSIAGLKFWDIKRWLLSDKFDVLIISETKLDSTFPTSSFHVGGYRLCRADRNRFGGGLIVFVKNNICFTKVTEFQRLQANEWAGFRNETIALRLKVAKSWLTVIGLYRPPSMVIKDRKEIANIFNDYFVNIAKDSNEIIGNYAEDFATHPSIISIHKNNTKRPDNDCFSFQLTNKIQVEQLILKMNTRKSFGHDFLPPRFIKDSAKVISAPIANIINTSISQCKYPSRWKMGQITPIFKKDDELVKQNYRPVTVLLCLNNIFEKLLSSQLEECYNRILSNFLSAYRKFHSCDTSLLRLTEDWRSRDKTELVGIVSLDLSKAFDTIPHALLLAKLTAYGLSSSACALLKGYLFGRLQKVKIGDVTSEWEVVSRGVPQGSVLGPLFFNIFINDLFYHITEVKLHAYADDEQLYVSDTDPKLLDRRLMHQLDIANEWYRSNGMLVNPTKYQAMIIGHTDHAFSFPVQQSIELFGIKVDNKLRFDEHLSNICKNITNQFNVISRFRKLLPATVLLRLYKAFIIPHFLYCSTVWHFCDSRNKDKLEMLNKRILRVILNDKVSSYGDLLQQIGDCSLNNKRIQNMLIIIFKCLHLDQYPQYLKELFCVRSVNYSMRGTDILSLPKPATTTYGLNSFGYMAAKFWNALPNKLRALLTLHDFILAIRQYTLIN